MGSINRYFVNLLFVVIVCVILITYYLLPRYDICKPKELIGPLEEKLNEFNNQVRVTA